MDGFNETFIFLSKVIFFLDRRQQNLRLFGLIYPEEIAFKVAVVSRFFTLDILRYSLVLDLKLNPFLLVIHCMFHAEK